jgi:hypothetical protein
MPMRMHNTPAVAFQVHNPNLLAGGTQAAIAASHLAGSK